MEAVEASRAVGEHRRSVTAGKVAHVPPSVTGTEHRAIHPHVGRNRKGTVMVERDLARVRTHTLLVVAVGVLLSAGVINVLIAVVESVLWPAIVGVGWVVVATGVVIEAEAATASSSKAARLISAQAPEHIPAHRG